MKIEIKIRTTNAEVAGILANPDGVFHVSAAGQVFETEVWDIYVIDNETVEVTLGAHEGKPA